MALIILTIIFTGISFIIFTVLRFKGLEKPSFIFKFLGSGGFVLIAILSFIHNGNNARYFCWLILALSFGFAGDIALGLKNIIPKQKKYLVAAGIIFFLVGHFMYSSNYITQGGVPWWIFVLNIGIAVLMMQVVKALKYNLSFFYKVVGHCYCYTISLMLISAVSYFFTYSETVTALLVLIGSISFFISDSLLSASYFKPDADNLKVLNLIVHLTYYPAQILLALSVLFI